MNGCLYRMVLGALRVSCLGAMLWCGRSTVAQNTPAVDTNMPSGVEFNAAIGTYSAHGVPTRSLAEVITSLPSWQHQILVDGSTSNYVVEDGILSMECPAGGLTRPSAIEIATIDVDSVIAYEAGVWRVGMRSKDGSQDFLGVLRGEAGSDTRNSSRADDDRRMALTALRDLYDLAYLTQNPSGSQAAEKGLP